MIFWIFVYSIWYSKFWFRNLQDPHMAPTRKTGNANKQLPAKNYAILKKGDEDVKTNQKVRLIGEMVLLHLVLDYTFCKWCWKWGTNGGLFRGRGWEICWDLYGAKQRFSGFMKPTESMGWTGKRLVYFWSNKWMIFNCLLTSE